MNSQRPLIEVKNLSKGYPVYAKASHVLLELVTRRRRHDLFWALKDVSFTIHEKQRVGIIGPNGSGKSTLLRILSGNLTPNSGTVHVNGKISAMLSLTSSLNPEETGLNNIRFNLLLNGYSGADIDRLADEIIEFTELGPFIYSPVKTYSSGMNAKLAFGITTAIEPEILLIDEVLSVGDAYFVGKAMNRVRELCEKGRGLLFVSHSTEAIQNMCDVVLWLDNGSVRMMGPAEDVVRKYEEDWRLREDEKIRTGNVSRKKLNKSKVFASEIESPDSFRIRLIHKTEEDDFQDTHYIKNLRVIVDSNESLVSLEPLPGELVTLDLDNSQWGRLYSKEGFDCRLLSARSGKLRGGQLVCKGQKYQGLTWKVRLELEAKSMLKKEELTVEFANLVSGQWERGKRVSIDLLKGGWAKQAFEVEVPALNKAKYEESLVNIKEQTSSPLEISAVKIVSALGVCRVVQERESFEVHVDVQVNETVPLADVGIKIFRQDGQYIFWQTSGQVAGNIENPKRSFTAVFRFDTNCFGAGKYNISAYIGNGWNLATNYPQSEIYDRKLNITDLVIQRELSTIDFGQVNLRVPVDIFFDKEHPARGPILERER